MVFLWSRIFSEFIFSQMQMHRFKTIKKRASPLFGYAHIWTNLYEEGYAMIKLPLFRMTPILDDEMIQETRIANSIYWYAYKLIETSE